MAVASCHYQKAFELAKSKVVGVDIGSNKYAQLQIEMKGNLPIVSWSFDYVVSFQVLEHVLKPSEYLAEAFRILKPGGQLFITTHGVWPYHPTPGDYHRWTKEGLLSELASAGFQEKSTSYVLNEYSAAVQIFVMTTEYRKVWKRKSARNLIHLLANILIHFFEYRRRESQTPAIICITGVKP